MTATPLPPGAGTVTPLQRRDPARVRAAHECSPLPIAAARRGIRPQ